MEYEQKGNDRRHDVDPGAVVLRHHGPVGGDTEAPRHDDAAAVHERRDRGNDLSVDVIERERADHTIFVREAVGAARVFASGNDTAMAVQDAFGHSRRARGIHEKRIVGFVERGEGRFRKVARVEYVRSIRIDSDDFDGPSDI